MAGFESRWRRNSAHDRMTLHCTESLIVIFPSSQYDLNNVERDVKHRTIIIIYMDGGGVRCTNGQLGVG